MFHLPMNLVAADVRRLHLKSEVFADSRRAMSVVRHWRDGGAFPLSSPKEDLSCLGNSERNPPKAEARYGPSQWALACGACASTLI